MMEHMVSLTDLETNNQFMINKSLIKTIFVHMMGDDRPFKYGAEVTTFEGIKYIVRESVNDIYHDLRTDNGE